MSVFQALARLENENGAGALCMVVSSKGSTPRNTGSKMLVYPDGSIVGTVGGGEMENRVIAEARQAILICGGQLEVYVEPLTPNPTMVIIGVGHVGKAVAGLAKWLGYRVVVNDDRPGFCTPEMAPDADQYVPVPMAELPQQLEITPWTYLILTTRGADVDIEGLPALLDSPAAYIGVIGSKKRWATSRGKMLEAGVSEEKLNRVRSPIGLELSAETPEEIAVSILAEIIMLRQGGDGSVMSG